MLFSQTENEKMEVKSKKLLNLHTDAFKHASNILNLGPKIRFREGSPSDIDIVKALEKESAALQIQHDPNHLREQLSTIPPLFFLLDALDKESNWKTLGAIQTQRI